MNSLDNLINPLLLSQMLEDKAAHSIKWRKYLVNNSDYETWAKWLIS